MEFWEAYECTILVQRYFHLKSSKLVTNKHSIAGKPVPWVCAVSALVLVYLLSEFSFFEHFLE